MHLCLYFIFSCIFSCIFIGICICNCHRDLIVVSDSPCLLLAAYLADACDGSSLTTLRIPPSNLPYCVFATVFVLTNRFITHHRRMKHPDAKVGCMGWMDWICGRGRVNLSTFRCHLYYNLYGCSWSQIPDSSLILAGR